MPALGYGQDIAVYEGGIGKVHRIISKRDLLAQDLRKRLETPRGTMLYFISLADPKYSDYEEYGYDLTLLLEQKFSPGRILATSIEVKNEMEKDDRVNQAIVNIDDSILRTSILKIEIMIIPISQFGGPFKMIMEVENAAISLFEVD